MGLGPSKAELEKIKIQTAATYKGVEIEWAAKKEIALAKIKLDEKTADLDHKFNMEKETNHKIKNTLHVQTQADIIAKIMEYGYNPEDFSMAVGLSYLTLKDELTMDEMETLKKMMLAAMGHKNKATGKGRHRHSSDTGCESDQDIPENQIVISTMT